MTVTTLQHMLLLKLYARAHNDCMACIICIALHIAMRIFMALNSLSYVDKSTCINHVICELKKSMPSDSQSQLQVIHTATRYFTQ